MEGRGKERKQGRRQVRQTGVCQRARAQDLRGNLEVLKRGSGAVAKVAKAGTAVNLTSYALPGLKRGSGMLIRAREGAAMSESRGVTEEDEARICARTESMTMR